MTYSFDTIFDRRSTESVKWNLFPTDVLPLWVADMDFAVPPVVTEALRQRIAHPIYGYPKVQEGLITAIQAHLQRKYDWQVDAAEDFLFLPGVVISFNLATQALAQPGGSLVFMTPVYMPFFELAKNAGLQQVTVDLVQDAGGHFLIDWERLETAIAARPNLLILCNPHNPVGKVFTRSELERVAEICLRYEVPIVADEIHSDLVYSGYEHTPLASLSPEIAANTITLMAPSKTFNVPGLGCSFAIITNPRLRNAFNLARRGLVHGANLMGMVAAQAAYSGGQDWLRELLVYLEGNRDFLVETIQHQLPHARITPPEGTYLAWIDLQAYNLEPAPSEFLIQQARVALNDGAEFGQAGSGFVRLNFACPRSTLTEALERIRITLEKVPVNF
ncbi:MAG TPA: PatB family C-S lyase [Bellilinea sp.]|nr:PatB family C-S lyase [Bellilinea sp.]